MEGERCVSGFGSGLGGVGRVEGEEKLEGNKVLGAGSEQGERFVSMGEGETPKGLFVCGGLCGLERNGMVLVGLGES